MRCGVVWCGLLRCSVVWCGVVWLTHSNECIDGRRLPHRAASAHEHGQNLCGAEFLQVLALMRTDDPGAEHRASTGGFGNVSHPCHRYRLAGVAGATHQWHELVLEAPAVLSSDTQICTSCTDCRFAITRSSVAVSVLSSAPLKPTTVLRPYDSYDISCPTIHPRLAPPQSSWPAD